MSVRNISRTLKRPLCEWELKRMERGEPVRRSTWKVKPQGDTRQCLWCGQVFPKLAEPPASSPPSDWVKYRDNSTLRELEAHVQAEHIQPGYQHHRSFET